MIMCRMLHLEKSVMNEGEGENLWEAATGDEGGELIIVENGIGMTLV
jgi:hypothetical protein